MVINFFFSHVVIFMKYFRSIIGTDRNMLLAKIISIPTSLYSRLQFPQSVPWYWSILLLFSILVAALLPGFAILGKVFVTFIKLTRKVDTIKLTR